MDPAETPLKQIRTFQGDVAEAIGKQQESLVSIQLAEHLKGSSVDSSIFTSEDSKKRKEFFLLLLGGLVLFVLGATGVWYTYNEFIRKTATPTTTLPANRFISVNAEINLNLADVSREIFINTFSDAIESAPPGEIRQVVFKKTTGEFLDTLESRAPASLVRAFDPLFMLGTLGKSTFLIIKLASFENAFAGMLLWEKSLAEDLSPLFATANLLKDLTPEYAFTDITDKNKDIR